MSTENIIAVFGVAVPLVIALITIAFELYTFRKESYNKRVTEERIKWLNKVREDYSLVMAAYTLKIGTNSNQNNLIDRDTYNNQMFEAEKAKFDLISRLNTNKYKGNEYNLLLKSVLENMNFCFEESDKLPNKEDIEMFKLNMNLMLEQEWRKSKNESTGKIQ